MHTRAAPKQKLLDPRSTGRSAADVKPVPARADSSWRTAHGVAFEQLMLDPGPDFAKTPRADRRGAAGAAALHAFGRPLLLAVSRKDFIGAITPRAPRARLPGTLAALGYGVDAGAHVLRVHDVAAAADFLAVRAALRRRGRGGSAAAARRPTCAWVPSDSA